MTEDIEESLVRRELQDLVLESAQIEEFLDGMVKIAARELTGLTGQEIYSAVTLLRPKRTATVASSSREAKNMDEVQYAFNDGPCLRAAREHYTVVVEDFHTESRFGEYARAVESHGLRSAIGVPILLEGEADAGLDLYCKEPNAFSAEAIDAAEQFARRASRSLQIAVRVSSLMESRQHLTAAMENRTTIDIAVGIIMGQNRCSQEEAVNILKAASSARNVKLHAVAAAVVEQVNQSSATTHFDA
ncbi:GAF domain-containing protein [Arthrobacter subterraneus]|uniref:GAF domain-containing protein n=1 Tax=Arthrobacter subterraneus TaxID=335973 RepID=A0A1G8KYJ3_9MICC|nr:GAF and ANTAR domain-containing protein [Arthrobacter subterraneus]SDI48451.1 GAF domain-containing protein [Arthrobacter subterraneus]